MPSDAAAIRVFAGRALVGGLSLAAGLAVLAILTGDFDDTETRVILTSIGFSVASGTASAGAAARLRSSETLRLIGTGTVLASTAAFGLLVIGLWTNMDEWGYEGVWRAFGCASVVGIAGVHACLALGARRQDDSEAVRTITSLSLALAAVDTVAILLPLLELVDEVGERWARFFGATLVLLILTSVLPPILRRIQPARVDGGPRAAVLQIADRIEALNADPGNCAPEIRAELKRLRSLANTFEA